MKKQFILILFLFAIISHSAIAKESLTPADLLAIKTAVPTDISSDGNNIMYRVITPRTANDEPGSAKSAYWILNKTSGKTELLDFGESSAFLLSYTPTDNISYLKKVDGVLQVFVKNGDEEKQVTHSKTNISQYKWSPNGDAIAYVATVGESERQKELDKRGYDFTFYEEDVVNDQLWLQHLDKNQEAKQLVQVTDKGNVWNFVFDHTGEQIAYTMSNKKLVDENYMFRKLHLYNTKSKKDELIIDNVGKFGSYHFSPDGTRIAYAAALDKYDSAISQAYIVDLKSKKISNITPKNYEGHISWASFKSDKEVIYLAAEGVENMLYTYNTAKDERKLILNSEEEGVIFNAPLFTDDFKTVVFSGNTPTDAYNVYVWNGKKHLKRVTDVNPELANKTMGEQEVIHYNARDGQEIEGILIKPVGYKEGKEYPLLMLVHGGPESHHSNGWLSRYSEPGQVFANKGYLVAYINYGSSTGYGIPFSKRGYGDPAAKEFDDLADAIDYICAEKGGDKNRVGMAGGSYGGYASAWFSTYYTKYIKASCVFVGISNVMSKKGTTDIPYEEIYVHTGKPLEECWEQSLKASPIYYASQSKTATLISGGAADTRVSPTQSYELYRRMKVNNHPAVRLVQYPGEGHGNRKQVGQIDFLYRIVDWMDWYVKDLKPLNGDMPPLDISDKYGLDW